MADDLKITIASAFYSLPWNTMFNIHSDIQHITCTYSEKVILHMDLYLFLCNTTLNTFDILTLWPAQLLSDISMVILASTKSPVQLMFLGGKINCRQLSPSSIRYTWFVTVSVPKACWNGFTMNWRWCSWLDKPKIYMWFLLVPLVLKCSSW